MAYTYKKRVNTNSKHSSGFPGGDPFKKNPSTGGNCTWWAWGRFKEVYKLATGKSLSWNSGSGNACAFYRIMGNHGYKTGKTPRPGAIICWGYYGKAEGNPGHVAFVEQVYPNGDIEISQSGWSSGPIANRKITKSSGYKFGYNNDHFNGFIYNKVDFTNPDGSVAAGGGHDKSWYIKKYGTGAEVYFEMQKYKYSHKAICAVLGNMQQESGIRVKTGGSFDGNGSEGLCQWTFGRKTKMQKYAKEHSASSRWDSVDGQVAYLHYELTHNEKSGGKVLANNSLSLDNMTKEFERKFERAADKYANLPARVKYAKTWDSRMSGAGDAEGGAYSEGAQAAVNMQQRSSQLYSSENYKWASDQEEFQESEASRKSREKTKSIKDYLSSINVASPENKQSFAVPDYITIKPSNKKSTLIKSSTGILPIAQAMVECPFVEIDFNGVVVGTLRNSVDDFPNHISNLEVEKINGQIHKYTVNIVHQIRPGEDPNLFDRILSRARYNKISLKYGDYSSNVVYGDEKIFITDVVMNRDYVSSRISYTIHATSAGSLITSYKLNFQSQTNKPSTIINDLLYTNKETSDLLLEAFPGMKNKTTVNSNNLIPVNDSPLELDEKLNISPIEYINYLVSCMSNMTNSKNSIIRNSSYYITYENDYDNKMGGAYFNISEISSDTIPNYGNHIYEINVGYPDNNFVMSFSVDNESAWSLFYNNSSVASEYIYSIDKNGNRVKEYSPNLMSSSNPFNEIQKNWWTSMVHFPINASIVLKGLIKPIMLMDYVIINVVFYGQKHITSGAYIITGQRDTLSSDGFRSTLALTRVGAN